MGFRRNAHAVPPRNFQLYAVRLGEDGQATANAGAVGPNGLSCWNSTAPPPPAVRWPMWLITNWWP